MTHSRRVAGLRLGELQCCYVATGSLIHKNENLTGHDVAMCLVMLSTFDGSMCCMLCWELRPREPTMAQNGVSSVYMDFSLALEMKVTGFLLQRRWVK